MPQELTATPTDADVVSETQKGKTRTIIEALRLLKVCGLVILLSVVDNAELPVCCSRTGKSLFPSWSPVIPTRQSTIWPKGSQVEG